MLPVQTIYSVDQDLTTIYGPWFPRGADYAHFAVEVPAMSATTSSLGLGVGIYHKNRDEPGDGAATEAPAQIFGNYLATTHVFHWDNTVGFKELVRYVFFLVHIGGSGTSWAKFRTLAPAWFNKL